MMETDRINSLGDELYQALRNQTTLAPLTDRETAISIEDAYHISLRMVNQRVERDGERIVGGLYDGSIQIWETLARGKRPQE